MNAQTTAKQTSKMSQIGKTRYMVQVAMLGAAAVVLMFFEMGPLAGAAIELIKILLNLVMKGSTTAGVGEVANFLIGCAYVMTAADRLYGITMQEKGVSTLVSVDLIEGELDK